MIRPALEGYPSAWFSPTYKMLTEVWRDVRSVLAPVTASIDRQQHRIELITGGVVEMWSLDNPQAPRGRKYAGAQVDEAAFVSDLEYAWNAVIRPTLVDYRGQAWFWGTPRGRNYFWTLWQYGQRGDDEWMSWQLPTTSNPYIDPAEVEAMRLDMPERTYQQEILAAFLEDGGGVFRLLPSTFTAERQEGPIEGHQYCAGVDWGKHQDFTVITVLDLTTKREAYKERFNQIDYTLQMGRLETVWRRFNPLTIIAEQNAMGDPLIEQAQRIGMPVEPFVTSNATKKAAIEALALALERDEVRLIDDPVTKAELQAYDVERLPSGLLRYGAPQGMHDDTVISLALAWQAASSPPPAMANWDRPVVGFRRR